MARVLALTPHETGYIPGQRSTIELWARPLAAAGIHLDYAPFESARLRTSLLKKGRYWTKTREMLAAYHRRWRLLGGLGNYDAVLIYREAALLGPAFFEKRIAALGKSIIYVLDDPLFVPYVSPVNGYLSYLKCFGKVATICRTARVVIVNSPQIRAFALQHNSNVHEIPSVVDDEEYAGHPRGRAGAPVCVGWSGSPTTAANLELVAEPLRELARRVEHRLLFIGAADLQISGLVYEARPWRRESEVADLSEMAIGLVPIPVRPWNHYKFYLKVAQYMALGIVPVATPLGSIPNVIEHGVNGLLASTASEWVEALQRLATSPSELHRMSEQARATARRRFTLKSQSDAVIGAFRSALTPQTLR